MTKRTLFMDKEHKVCFVVLNEILSCIDSFQKITINSESYLVAGIENRLTSLGEDYLLERLIIVETEAEMEARFRTEMDKTPVFSADSSEKELQHSKSIRR